MYWLERIRKTQIATTVFKCPIINWSVILMVPIVQAMIGRSHDLKTGQLVRNRDCVYNRFEAKIQITKFLSSIRILGPLNYSKRVFRCVWYLLPLCGFLKIF